MSDEHASLSNPNTTTMGGDMQAFDIQNQDNNNANDGFEFRKGELQEPAFRDKIFGIIFIAHFVTMIAVGACYASGALITIDGDGDDRRRRLDEDEEDDEDTDNVVLKLGLAFALALFLAPGLSILMMTRMKAHAKTLIEWSLFFSIGFNLLLLVVFALTTPLLAILPAVFVLILVCYAKAVWHRIPFAAANLKAAITVVQANLGMAVLALVNLPLVVCWMILWGYVTGSVVKSPWFVEQETTVEGHDDVFGDHEETAITAAGNMAIFGLVLSFYWTLEVMKNVVHTTLAGTVGTWWFVPHEANSCCSRGLTDSLCRSLSYSFGSICLGSLIVAIIETLQSFFRSQARNSRGGVLRLIAQCLLHLIERIAEYFNKWAFVYVGLYGYSYVEAGKNVLSLFRHRGWTAIISDSLVTRMLIMMSFCVGLVNAVLTALFSWIFERGTGEEIAIAALWALLIGFLLSGLVFQVLVSAVDSIIVLYAEAPQEFAENHPELAREMQETWTQAWPDIFSPGGGAAVVATVVPDDDFGGGGGNYGKAVSARHIV
jgi:hypothetical protein